MESYNCCGGGRSNLDEKLEFKLSARFSIRRALTYIIVLAGVLVIIFLYYTSKQSRRQELDVDSLQSDQKLLKVNGNVDTMWQATSRLMTCQLHGRIGNMMFAYAALVGIASRNARTPALPAGHFFRSFFRLRAANLPEKLARRENMKEKSAGIYDDRTEWINSEAEVVQLVGYFQSWKYFARVVDEIRREFSFNRELQRDANEFLRTSIEEKFGSDYTRRDVVLVGIHVRVKDMSSNASLAYGYSVAPTEYLSAAMEYFQNKFSANKLMFILATDDPEWCARNFPSSPGSAVVRTPRGPDILDLVILSNCNHMIITVGSYGWWAAWLSGGTTVYYKNFPYPGSSLSQEYSSEDYYPASWIAM